MSQGGVLYRTLIVHSASDHHPVVFLPYEKKTKDSVEIFLLSNGHANNTKLTCLAGLIDIDFN